MPPLQNNKGKEYGKKHWWNPHYTCHSGNTVVPVPLLVLITALRLFSGHRTERVSFHSNPKERQCQRMLKLPHNCTHSHASKLMLKILQARLQQYMNRELPNVQAGFRKAEEPEIKLPTSAGSSKKQESSRKISISALLTMPKLLTVWITINCGKFWKR